MSEEEDKEEGQLTLWDQWPEEPELVEKARDFLHTGRTSLRNDVRCHRICEAVLCGAPWRTICREFRVGHHTIQAIVRHYEESGKLVTLQKRLAGLWSDVALLGAWRLREKLAEDKVPVNVLGMVSGIATDKMLLLTGQATERIEQKRTVEVPDLEAAWARLQAVRSRVIDVESAAPGESEAPAILQNQAKSAGPPGLDTGLDTPGQAPEAAIAPAIEGSPAPPAEPAAEAGGGVAGPRHAQPPTHQAVEIPDPKES